MKQSLTIEFKAWADGLISFRCSNANLISKLSFNPFDDLVHQTDRSVEEIVAEIQMQFGDAKPSIKGDIYSWERTLK